MTDKHRIIILGAGFSRPAGFPLANELWKEIRAAAANLTRRARRFANDLNKYVRFRKECDGVDISPDDVDFEEFMQFLDIEHYLSLRGSDTWSTEGNETTIATKYLIGKILARKVTALGSIPDLYLEFARRLGPKDIVITFNYDPLLEHALDALRKPYRLFSMRYESVSEYHAVSDDTRAEVVLLKVHGSIDWFDRAPFEERAKLRMHLGTAPPQDVIFSFEKELGLVPLLDGPRYPDDPLRSVYRARNLGVLYERDFLSLPTPRILPPSAAKIVYATKANDFRSGIDKGGLCNGSLAIIGFSLPKQDDYARQIMHALVTNYQRHNIFDQIGHHNVVAPLSIVDYFSNEKTESAFKQRYRFVDWSKTSLRGSGFDMAALDDIFA